ncbi:MAG: hypothetical protein ACTTJZ_05895 [Sphaerochaetaceae bacterium]
MANKCFKLHSKGRKFSQNKKGLTLEEFNKLSIERQAALRELSYSSSKERIDAKKSSRQKWALADAQAAVDKKKAREEAKLLARQKAEEAKLAKQEAKKKAKEDKEAARKAEEERKAADEAEKLAREAAEKKAAEEAEKAAADKKAADEAARTAETERKAADEAARKAEEERKAAEEAEKQAQDAVEVYRRLKRLTKAEVIRAAKIAGKGADEAIATFRELDKKLEEINAEIKAAKTPKDADEATRADFNKKRAAMRAERAAMERDRTVAHSKAISLEKIGDEYTLAARYITKDEELDFRKTERLYPLAPNLKEKALPLFERLEATLENQASR